jgi:deoxyribodipyrimidine photo-lyase
MTDTLSFSQDDPRVRRLNDCAVPTRGDYVLYWMQAYRRGDDNAALAYAIGRANDLGVPCVVFESLRPDYPHASDRIHTFVLQGAVDTAVRLQEQGVTYVFFLPRTASEARGVLAKLAARARVVVSDDYPSFVIPAHNAAAAARVPCPFVVVDDCAIVPMALLSKPEIGARTLRPKLTRGLAEWLRPIEEPRPKHRPLGSLELPFEPLDLKSRQVAQWVAQCEIDRSVPPVTELAGGTAAGLARLDRFTRGILSSYDVDRNDPSRDGTSSVSPYLHFGMLSARRTALRARTWGAGEGLAAFLEQLLVRRALSFNFARSRADHNAYAAVPAWAKATLAEHAPDRRYADLSGADLEAARSPDPLWNAAMNELRARGTIHGYARMLWGKLPLLWMRRPQDAHAAAVHLNDKWALDGRDPNGYANIGWCFGLHDRPWPKRPVFGAVRCMTSASARRKLDFEGYIERWSSPDPRLAERAPSVRDGRGLLERDG